MIPQYMSEFLHDVSAAQNLAQPVVQRLAR